MSFLEYNRHGCLIDDVLRYRMYFEDYGDEKKIHEIRPGCVPRWFDPSSAEREA